MFVPDLTGLTYDKGGLIPHCFLAKTHAYNADMHGAVRCIQLSCSQRCGVAYIFTCILGVCLMLCCVCS